MHFRFRAFALHLLVSLSLLTLVFGTLYLGWYRWPGWYLAGVSEVVLVMAAVDLVVGPALTFVIAAPLKPRRELLRDVSLIATVQLIALTYGAHSLWNGRPMYYAFSENVLQLVQAYDIDDSETQLAERQHSALVPHWYSLPRWIWAPLPKDEQEHDRILQSAITGGDDVISMPRYYQAWQNGALPLKGQLKKVADVGYFSPKEKQRLGERMREAGYSPDSANAIPFTGRGHPLLAVFDPATAQMTAIFRST